MCNSIRSFFRITFFAVISTFVLFSVSSCSDLFSYITSTSVSNSNAGETITFTGTVRSAFADGGAFPTEYVAQFAQIAADGAESASASTAGRSAIPSLPNDTPTTTVTATATGEPDVTQPVTGDSFAIPLKSDKTWTVIVEMKNGSTTILSDSAEFDLTTVTVTTHEFVLKPVSAGSGTIALGFSTPDSAFDSVTVVSVKKNNEDASSAWTNSVNCSASGLSMKTNETLAAGVYSVCLRFAKGAYSYTSIQEINVFPGLETNTWVVSNKDSDGKFQVTQSMMSMSEIYVGSTVSGIAASDVTGTGSPYKPYATLEKAITVVNSLPVRTATDDPYIIRVKNGTANEVTSTITISNNISIECYDSSFSDKAGTATLTWNSSDTDMLKISSGAKLTIDGNKSSGANPTWSGLVLDGNKSGDMKGRGADVLGGGAFVMKGGTIKNFSLQDESGSGVNIALNGKFDMQGGMIKDNEATRTGSSYAQGGGVYVDRKATFAMSDGVLSGNSAYAGGGVFVSGSTSDVTYNGLFMMSGGVISGNSASNSGGGVDLVNGTLYMYGSAVIGDKNATAHAEAEDNQHSNTAKKGSAISTSGMSPRLFIGYKEPAEGETDPRLDNDFDGGIYYNFATETNHSSTERGGAIFVKCDDEDIKIANCVIKYNGSSTDGGGIFVYMASGDDGLVIKNTEISDNFSDSCGGGIYICSTYTVSLENCTVDNNIATSQGGGVFVNQSVHFSASAVDGDVMLIRGNQAKNGAGLYVRTQYCTIRGAEISGNQASGSGGGNGGGIYIDSYTTTNPYKCSLYDGTVVKNNTATGNGSGVYVDGVGGSIGALALKGTSYVASDNDVYLGAGSYAARIFIDGALNPPSAAGGKVAKITPKSYPSSGNVSSQYVFLAESPNPTTTLPAEVGKFAVTPNEGKDYVVNSDGKIAEDTGFVLVNGATVSTAVSGSYVFVSDRTVTIRSMYVCKHEVTQAEYQSIMGTNPSQFKGSPADGEVQEKRPVEYVKWYEALVYCNKRSEAEHLTSCYSINGSTDPSNWGTPPTSDDSTWDAVSCDWSANGYRLPTEAEWEYIARGGNNGIPATQTSYSGSNTADAVAWFQTNSGSKTHQVMLKAPNTLGIYDLSGNVHEWCWDKYAADGSITVDTPDDGPTSFRGGAYAGEGSTHVKRGGYYDTSESYLTVSESRDYFAASVCSPTCGFRVVRTANTTPGS